MNEKDLAKYVEHLVAINNIKPNHIITTETTKRPKIAADMEKIASVKIKGDARRETLAKSTAYAEARVRYAIYHLNYKMGINPTRLKITEAWSASNIDSKIMWIKADRETISLLKSVKAEAHRKQQPIDIEFMEWTPGNHQKIRNKIKEKCNKLRSFNKY